MQLAGIQVPGNFVLLVCVRAIEGTLAGLAN